MLVGNALDVILLSKTINWQKCTKPYQITQSPKSRKWLHNF